jgi:hypothetical protein
MIRSGNKVVNTLEEAIQSIEGYILGAGEITAIEFSLCSDAMKLKYLDKFLNKRTSTDRQMPMWLFSWCSDDKKLEIIDFYISKCWKFTRDMIKICPKESIEKYIDYRIKDGDLYTFEAEFLNERQVGEYINNKVDLGEWLLNEEFNKLTEQYKLLYIIAHGANNVDDEIREWFDIWKKAKGRDLNIDKILLD